MHFIRIIDENSWLMCYLWHTNELKKKKLYSKSLVAVIEIFKKLNRMFCKTYAHIKCWSFKLFNMYKIHRMKCAVEFPLWLNWMRTSRKVLLFLTVYLKESSAFFPFLILTEDFSLNLCTMANISISFRSIWFARFSISSMSRWCGNYKPMKITFSFFCFFFSPSNHHCLALWSKLF